MDRTARVGSPGTSSASRCKRGMSMLRIIST
jgi:hypothetical protein